MTMIKGEVTLWWSENLKLIPLAGSLDTPMLFDLMLAINCLFGQRSVLKKERIGYGLRDVEIMAMQ